MQPANAASLELKSISLYVCYLTVQNKIPVPTQRPDFPTKDNREAITTTMNMVQPYPIPNFRFIVDIKAIDNIAPPYLCAIVDGDNFVHLYYY